MQVSSAGSERDFSQVGLTVTARRARLLPESVEAVELVKSAKKRHIFSIISNDGE